MIEVKYVEPKIAAMQAILESIFPITGTGFWTLLVELDAVAIPNAADRTSKPC